MKLNPTTLSNLNYSDPEIRLKTMTIYAALIGMSDTISTGNFDRISTSDLHHLFLLYDQHFFGGVLSTTYQDVIKFRLSKRMTRAAGKTTCFINPRHYEICISTTLMFQTFHDVQRDIKINGLLCHDRLQALMRIFEHELVHLVEMIIFGSSSCTRSRFKALSANIFGHTGVTHQLVTAHERAFKRYQLRVGDEVTFDFQGSQLQGIISRITKRATVFVPDGRGAFTDANGKRYTKYYIPISLLQRADEPMILRKRKTSQKTQTSKDTHDTKEESRPPTQLSLW